MFVDNNSKKLINYLADHEPSKVDGKKIYPVPSLVSSFDPNQNHWSEEYLKPYLVTLQELGLILSFHFPNTYSVQIETTAHLLHFDEYQLADAAKVSNQPDSNLNQNDCPHPSSETAQKTSWYKDSIGLAQAAVILAAIGLVVAVVFCILGLVF